MAPTIEDYLSEKFICIDDMPSTTINLRQASDIMGVSTATVLNFVREGILSDVGEGELMRVDLRSCLILYKNGVKNLRTIKKSETGAKVSISRLTSLKQDFDRFYESELRTSNRKLKN